MTDPTQAERDDVMGAGIAVMAAMERGDLDGAAMILDGVDLDDLTAFLLGMVRQLGVIAAGSPERWAAMLADWQPGQRLGDGLTDD